MYLFALYRDRLGQSSLDLEMHEGATVGDVAEYLTSTYPQVFPPPAELVVAVNQEYAEGARTLHEGDEIALIPPVSGGSSMVVITTEPLDPEVFTRSVLRDTNGGIVTFLGVTRRYSAGKEVRYLEYEAYRPMAEGKLREIADEVRERWGTDELAIGHRIGPMEIGETSLVVAVGMPHRAEAFEACQHVVDRLKQIVPIWKKEVFTDGEVWVGAQEGPHVHAGSGAGD